MKIIRAEEMGMCFGVRDALQIVDQVVDPTKVTIHGELVHNPRVIHQLDVAGFVQSPEAGRNVVPETPMVLITAHGVSDKERARLNLSGKQLIDTTCPLVRRAHDAAMKLAAEGRHVLLIGKPGHVEVQGIVEDLDSYDVVANVDAVKKYGSNRIGIVCQTTMPSCLLGQIRKEIAVQNAEADICFVDTVCHPTKRRQADGLAPRGLLASELAFRTSHDQFPLLGLSNRPVCFFFFGFFICIQSCQVLSGKVLCG